jgi:hypothetical protein
LQIIQSSKKIKIKSLSCNSAGGRERVADAGVLSLWE